MKEIEFEKITKDLLETFINSGKIALDLRDKGLITNIKSDNTPVTNADLKVNEKLCSKIKSITPNIPIISEETVKINKKNVYKNFWLVDPIDGTYDYINGLEEFTINAALILNRIPVAGLINAPAKKRMFYSYGKGFSFELTNGKLISLKCKKKTEKKSIQMVSYSNNINPDIENIYKRLGVTKHTRMKSSLKFCVIASGEFDGYVAEPRACEWDIAAGHAILENAGGSITDFKGNKILYGKEQFNNPSLIVKRNENL